MIDLGMRDLAALSALARRRNFRAAANDLGVPPSTLSHNIASLEKRLGVRLFNRSTRSVSLTQAGEAFLARVQPAAHDIAAAVEAVGRFRNSPVGRLRLNASEGGAERILPIAIGFMGAYPEMWLDVVTDGRLVDIAAEGFDAGIRLAESVPHDMISIPLGMDEAFAVVASPGYLERRGVPGKPADLKEHECIRTLMPSGAMHRWEFERRGRMTRVEPLGRLTLGSERLALEAARSGMGLAYITERAAQADLAAGRLIRIMSDWTPPFAGICLYYPRQRLPSAGLKAFIDFFRAGRGIRTV